MNRKTISLVLSNRSFLYNLLARGFAEEADGAFLQILADGHTAQELMLVDHDLTGDIMTAYEAALEHSRSEGTLEEIRRAYVEMFAGPQVPKAYPWETVHLSSTHTLFAPELAAVREAYRDAGFLPARYPHVQDDFIGLELDFLAKLADAAHAAWESGDEVQADLRLEQSRAFLEEHLLRWIDSLARAIAREYGEGFFACFARLAALVAHRDFDTLSA